MLSYARAKSIGVQKQGADVRVVSGVLEDELYAMQCEMQVHWPTLTIDAIQTRMKRFTTERCVKAEGYSTRPKVGSWKKILKEESRRNLGGKAVGTWLFSWWTAVEPLCAESSLESCATPWPPNQTSTKPLLFDNG